MRSLSARTVLRAFGVSFLALVPVVARAEAPRVVIALDSSRSLAATESRAAAALARDLWLRLGATTAPAVLTFDDRVRWLGRPGDAGVDTALEAIVPSGRFTVMHDGLVEGVRALEDGGVLVLITDGKDENSATTIEDVARLAGERGVRVVTVGAGRVDERTMRRLALLTGGAYAGTAAGADPDALTAEIEALRRAVEAEQAPPPAAPAPPVEVAAPAPPPAAEPPAPAPDGARVLLLVGALVAAFGIVTGFLLARRRAPAEPSPVAELDAGTKPGVAVPEPPREPAPAALPEPVDELGLARLRGRPPLPPGGLMEVSLDDTAAFQRLPFAESIERTLVLAEEVVLTAREPGRGARSFRIPPGRAIDIGREPKRNTLAFPDPTMSVVHLRLALEDGEVHLLDLGSTNGVLVHERRVLSARLRPGEKFRAGMIEFELNLHRASLA
jgi:hypothetical protein